jgi:hypothetical protein
MTTPCPGTNYSWEETMFDTSAFDADEKDSTVMVVFKLVGGVAMTLAAPFLAYYTVKLVITARSSMTWPEAQGTVTRFEAEQFGRRGMQFYRPKVDYRFSVDGKDFSGSKVVSSYDSPIRSDLAEFEVKFGAGTQHPVYYDPANPNESRLERGTNWLTYLSVLFPLVFGIVGPIMIKEQSQMLRRRMNKKQSIKSKSGNKPRRRRPLPPPEE